MLCPAVACGPLHGCHTEFFYDSDAECFVLEVWPVGLEEPEEHSGSGHVGDQGLLYELAEFDFTELAKLGGLASFHFSQLHSIFEIAWQEDGQDLELRVHIAPVEVEET